MAQPDMLGSGLRGPFDLSADTIDEEIVENCPGAYALGFIDNLGRFSITFVGSSVTNLKSVLKARIGTASQFKFRHFAEPRQAFEKECEMFHQFMPVGNFLHPGRPVDTNWTCPRCRR